MLFHSIEFALFFPVVFVIYWFVLKAHLKAQNAFILLVSYVFYGWWDYRFLLLILTSTLVDYIISRQLHTSQRLFERRLLLAISLSANLGMLMVFKYYNFFIDNFVAAFQFFGASLSPRSVSLILPVGISFYTFQTLSYTIDIFKKKIAPSSDFIAFAAFVSFFPQLVAGPIERAKSFLPQFHQPRQFRYEAAIDGLRQILWGLFKKVVIADNCAEYVNMTFGEPSAYSGSALFFGMIFFSFQIYCDFSGYSDIAIGLSKLLGFRLKQNFAFPYFSRNVAEFWRRWHISLSTWFRDYLYIPLGGSRVNNARKIRNTFVVFWVSGFWHGANWTFIFWGLLHAIYFLPLLLLGQNRKYLDVTAQDRILPSIRELWNISLTFTWISVAWVFFRADSIGNAFDYLKMLVSPSLFSVPNFEGADSAIILLLGIIFLLVMEWMSRKYEYGLAIIEKLPNRLLRYAIYYTLIFVIYYFNGKEQEFIYFQF